MNHILAIWAFKGLWTEDDDLASYVNLHMVFADDDPYSVQTAEDETEVVQK